MAHALRTLARFRRSFRTEGKALAWPENAHWPRGAVCLKRSCDRPFRIANCLGRYVRDVGPRWNHRTGQKPCLLIMFRAANGRLPGEELAA